jgi:hypothetical protein
MKKIILPILLVIFSNIRSQDVPSYVKSQIKEQQISNVRKIINELEKGQSNKVIKYFVKDSSAFECIEQSIIEIRKVFKTSNLSIVLIIDNGYNIYRCRYVNDTDELFQIDLYYGIENANLLVQKCKIKTIEQLKSEKKTREDYRGVPPWSSS